MYNMNNRAQMRQPFFEAWEKFQTKQPLSDLEQQLLQVIIEHPEYHYLFQDPEKYKDKDFSAESGETNPYMHFGVHLAIRDQVSMHLPLGIREVFEKLCEQQGSKLEAEHRMIECFSNALWQAMQSGEAFNNDEYLRACRELLGL